MRTLAIFSTLLASVVQVEGGDRPNIVLIMADDLGWSDIGCYGGEIPTPHIDSLADTGLSFTQFYNNSVCGPTRASLLTGLYCQQVGHAGYRWNDPKDYTKCVLLTEVLQRAGYRTMMVGKWQGRDLAVQRGCDRFFGPMCQAKISYFHEVQNNPFYLDDARWELPDDFYMTDAFNDYAVQFLDAAIADDAPFFLYVAHIAPHWPLHARETDIAPHRERYRATGWDELRRTRSERQRELGLVSSEWELSPRPDSVHAWNTDAHQDWQAERMAVYAAQVARIDDGVGRILRAIEDAGQTNNTLVMFLSDNGAAPDGGASPTMNGFGFGPNAANDNWRTDGVAIRPGSGPENPPGPHDTFAAYGLGWATASNTPLRGTKLTGYEGGIRTPLVVRWPAVIPAKRQLTDQVGHVMDIMATCLDVAEASYPETFDDRRPLPMEGRSLRPIFAGQQREGHAELCWSVPRHQVIRMGDWKLIKPVNADQWQLFDLDSDGTETTDLADQHSDQVEMMSRRFEKWRVRVGAR